MLPDNLSTESFGEGGFVAVRDREDGRVLFHPEGPFLSGATAAPLPDRPAPGRSASRRDPGRDGGGDSFRYARDGRAWMALIVPVAHSTLEVVSSSPLDGFSRPFHSAARTNLILVLAITLLASAVFLLTTLRTTDSLVKLTAAAARVADGDLSPELPPAGRDEAGTLADTFRLMLSRIRAMLVQVEESRQLAAVGQFSAQIAHEIRNPLTAIHMSLQGLQRRLADTEHARSLEIALQETERLDRVATGVLGLGRKPSRPPVPVPAATLVQGAIDSIAGELAERGVDTRLVAANGDALVLVDEEALRGALLNLLRNAAEAMPGGGEILVNVEVVVSAADRTGAGGGDVVRIHIVDGGPGVAEELAPRIFDPFVTTRARGNGFGLPLALQTAEANGGTIRLLPAEPGAGAHFVLEIPIHEAGA